MLRLPVRHEAWLQSRICMETATCTVVVVVLCTTVLVVSVEGGVGICK